LRARREEMRGKDVESSLCAEVLDFNLDCGLVTIGLRSSCHFSDLNHFQWGTVLEEAVSLKDKGILVPVLSTVDSDGNGLDKLLDLKLVRAFLKVRNLDQAIISGLTSRDNLNVIVEVLQSNNIGASVHMRGTLRRPELD
jgi:hypothetical protein